MDVEKCGIFNPEIVKRLFLFEYCQFQIPWGHHGSEVSSTPLCSISFSLVFHSSIMKSNDN